MKKAILICCLFSAVHATSQNKSATSFRSVLLAQFQSTYNQEDWFVPVMIAVQGLTAKQAMWKPSDSCHSIGELTYHLLYWDKEQLDKIKGVKPAPFSGNNRETFTAFTETSWASTVSQLNGVLGELEKVIKEADDPRMDSLYGAFAHISTHNAYHTGQIIYVRKLQGSWDASKGVK